MSLVTVEHQDNGVSLIAINRPERKNAICADTALQLQSAFAEFDRSAQRALPRFSTVPVSDGLDKS